MNLESGGLRPPARQVLGEHMDRYWLLTSSTYGTRLPGDERGFVSNVRVDNGPEIRHNIPGTPIDANMQGLRNAALEQMKGSPIFLDLAKAQAIIAQFQETATHRKWELCAASVMFDHFHLVVGVEGDPDPWVMLRDFKSYASRALNRKWGKPPSETWWTESGSKRKLPNDEALRNGVMYVRDQREPLVVWLSDFWKIEVGELGSANGPASGGRYPPDL